MYLKVQSNVVKNFDKLKIFLKPCDEGLFGEPGEDAVFGAIADSEVEDTDTSSKPGCSVNPPGISTVVSGVVSERES
ncbi:unnamed protein product [[Candida] boidinii]|nr:unnamed protein product [[Candida] boidinii]